MVEDQTLVVDMCKTRKETRPTVAWSHDDFQSPCGGEPQSDAQSWTIQAIYVPPDPKPPVEPALVPPKRVDPPKLEPVPKPKCNRVSDGDILERVDSPLGRSSQADGQSQYQISSECDLPEVVLLLLFAPKPPNPVLWVFCPKPPKPDIVADDVYSICNRCIGGG